MSVLIRWAWIALTAIALLAFARMTRYSFQPIGETGFIWDRWGQRACTFGGKCWGADGYFILKTAATAK